MMILLLAHFPTLYTDELLYSGIARYHQISGNRSQSQTITDLFGDRRVCSTFDLPSHLEELTFRIGYGYSADQLIQDHTLYPYYTYFLSKAKSDQVKFLMRNGSTSGVIHANLGLLASLIKAPSYAKYCPSCYSEEKKKFEPYWHRSHQLPGVMMCGVHKVPLVTTDLTYSTREHKFAFIPLAMLGERDFQVSEINSTWKGHLQFIAEHSDVILHSPPKQNYPTYTSLFGDKGYLTIGNCIRFDKLIHDFQAYFSDDFLNIINCQIDASSDDTWLHKLLRDHEVTHPLRHILLRRFLGLTVGTDSSNDCYDPFGKGPWPCLNHAAQHYKSNVIDGCNITRCSKSGLPVGTFACSCGFVYSRRGPDSNAADRYKVGRIKWFGEVWFNKLQELSTSNKSLREKARILGVDPGTVKKQVELLNNNLHSRMHYKASKQIESKIVELSESDGGSIKNSVIKRVDWASRDGVLSSEVAKAVEKILDIDPPQRIMATSIARLISDQNLSIKILKKSLDKLPKTKSLIQASLETTEDYQVRRLAWVNSILQDSEMKVEGWRVLKMAGLKFPLCDLVAKKFHELIS